MKRREKEQVVQSLKESFGASPASFVVGYKGLTVSEMQNLRKKLREQGGVLRVTKARLMKIAVEDNDKVKSLQPYFKDQIGLVFSPEPSSIAKVLRDFAKKHEALQLVVGQLDAELLDANAIKRIATLPSREQLLAQLCGALNAPISNLASVLRIQLIRLLIVLKQLSEKK